MTTSAASLFSTAEFDPALLPFPLEGRCWVTIEPQNRLFRLLPPYIATHAVELPPSLRVRVLASKKGAEEFDSQLAFGRVALDAGSGHVRFRSFEGNEFDALLINVGTPVGGGCGVEWLRSLVLFTDGPIELLAQFLSALIERSERAEEGRFTCYTWQIDHGYWREEAKIQARPLESVVLPAAVKARLVADVDKFLSPRSQAFYLRNGIPYRRAYLFHGVPGTGKTSFVQALAGHFKRSVSFLLPTHPKMTDDALRTAINLIPDDTIVVFEDIDALFSSDRGNRVAGSALTFSGLLNALDGISNPNGQIFVLTTNLRDNLDAALIRQGRVDMHVEFTYALPEQMSLMWTNFYPAAADLATAFAEGVQARLDAEGLQVTTSALQHFFVAQMDATPEEALAALGSIVDDLRANSSQAMLRAAQKETVPSPSPPSEGKEEKEEGTAETKTRGKGKTWKERRAELKMRRQREQEKKKELRDGQREKSDIVATSTTIDSAAEEEA